MVYSSLFQQRERKIPTVVFFLVIFILFVIFSFVFGHPATPSRADRKVIKRIEVANVSPNEVGIYWQTTTKSISYIMYGETETSLSKIALDDRDIADNKVARTHHLATIHLTQAATGYFYKFIVDDKIVSDIGEKSFTFQTPKELAGSTRIGPAYGKIVGVDQNPLKEAIVIMSFEGAFPFVTLSRDSGEWLIAYNSVVNKQTLTEKSLSKMEKATIEIYSGNDEKSTISSDLPSLTPLPQTIVIGKDYSFKEQSNVLAASSSQTSVTPGTIEVLFPVEGGLIPGTSPLIKGTAIPGHEVLVMINGATSYSHKVFADKDGIWSIKVSNPLTPGNHSLRMTTVNEENKEVVINRSFIIAKSGEQVLGVATLSASPTLMPSATPTITISSSPVSTESATPTPPTSGSNISPWFFISGAFIIGGLGVLLAF